MSSDRAYHGRVTEPKKRLSVAAIIGIVLGVTVLAVVAFVAIGAVIGFRQYQKAVKVVEARAALSVMAKDAVAAYENGGDPFAETAAPKMCPSASKPVPAERSAISGRVYASTPAEWQVDKERNAGFACLRFEMTAPQRYQYEYIATDDSFTARAWGDIDGNGIYSKFEIHGVVEGGRLRVDPNITETMPDE